MRKKHSVELFFVSFLFSKKLIQPTDDPLSMGCNGIKKNSNAVIFGYKPQKHAKYAFTDVYFFQTLTF